MKITREMVGKLYLPAPPLPEETTDRLPMNWDLSAFSRALGVPTGYIRGIGKQRGSIRLFRRDLVEVFKDNPWKIFDLEDEGDLCWLAAQMPDTLGGFYYESPTSVAITEAGVVTLKNYPNYVSMDGIKSVVETTGDTEEVLRGLHKTLNVPIYKSLQHYREHSRNRVWLYRKDIAHLLLFPNMGANIKSVLLGDLVDTDRLKKLSKFAGLYTLYPKLKAAQ